MEIEGSTELIFPDDIEIFADQLEIFFRNEVPEQINGRIISISDHVSDPLLCVVETTEYIMPSTGDTLTPNAENPVNFEGGIFSTYGQNHIIRSVENVTNGVRFILYKRNSNSPIPTIPEGVHGIESPSLELDGLFIAIENMINPESWGTPPNPHSFKIDLPDWQTHREVVEEGSELGETTSRFVEKSRGIWGEASIERIDENGEHRGLYSITFNDVTLGHHSQYQEVTSDMMDAIIDSVDWYKGVIRVHGSNPNTSRRRILQVEKIMNIGSGNNLELIVNDIGFSTDSDFDEISIGSNVEVNFYPGFKIYLVKNQELDLIQSSISPEQGEVVKESIFAMRSLHSTSQKVSKLSSPSLLVVEEVVKAKKPEDPIGALFSTRPDQFGRSTYTFTTKFLHKPHSVLFYRSNDDTLLHALYDLGTVKLIKNDLDRMGGFEDAYIGNRWQNFFDFEKLEGDGDYTTYPQIDEGYKFPLPNHPRLLEEIQNFIDYHNQTFNNNLQLPDLTSLSDVIIPATSGQNSELLFIDFIKQVVNNAFGPLTQVPILYIDLERNGKDYIPENRPQKIRDENGYILPFEAIGPESGRIDTAPMAKEIAENEVQFTDFKLDGTSRNLYFYRSREMGNELKLGAFSEVLGPIRIVHSNPLEAPEVVRIIPLQENKALGVSPSIKVEINAFNEQLKIKHINVYRTTSRVNAESVRFMDLVGSYNIEDSQQGEKIWSFRDEFTDLQETPYGSNLYYRVTALREVVYKDQATGNNISELAPSQPSKIYSTVVAEVYAPNSPELVYESDDTSNDILSNVTLSWNKSGLNHSYTLYKLSKQGNWQPIYDVTSDQPQIQVALSDTEIQDPDLPLFDQNNDPIYHHFKVVAKNSSGMYSLEEKILTISGNSQSSSELGIGQMSINSSFEIR